jgi:hypothetical protein
MVSMSDNVKTVKMALIDPGQTGADGEFTFALQPRYNAARTVIFDLIAIDAENLHKALGAYLKATRKTKE